MTKLRTRLIAGVVGGLLGGLVFGAALANSGMMTSIAGLFRFEEDGTGWIIHLVISAVIGLIYGYWSDQQLTSVTYNLAAGGVYGFVWWCLGSMTLAPLLAQGRVDWTMEAAAAAFPSLIGHLFYGGITGLVYQQLLPILMRRAAPIPVIDQPRSRIVILGGGFGGLAAAMRFENLLRRYPQLEVTLISDSNYALFTPMLAEVAASALEAPHISSSLRSFFREVRFRRAAVLGVDLSQQTVTLQNCETCQPTNISYDHLLVGLGSISFDFGLPGIGEFAFTLKTLEDAIVLRDHALTLMEIADIADHPAAPGLLTFVVAGAGFSGMEIVAELFEFVASALPYYPGVARENIRFVVVHSGEHVLPELSTSLADYAQRKLAERGIEFKLGQRVAGCSRDSVTLSSGEVIAAHTLVWTTGNRVHPVVAGLEVTKVKDRIETDATLRSASHPNIWAVGDCASNPQPDGKPYAPTAQNASRSGKKAAENILAAIMGKPLKPFVFAPLGALVVLGRRTAAAEIRQWKFSGLLAWLMWRSIYLSKLPGTEKKIRVLIDWIVEFFFPRDVVLTQRVIAPRSSKVEKS